jgi:hypothetical protein
MSRQATKKQREQAEYRHTKSFKNLCFLAALREIPFPNVEKSTFGDQNTLLKYGEPTIATNRASPCDCSICNLHFPICNPQTIA